MTIRCWKDFLRGGFVYLSYDILRDLETVTAIVFCQILAEYNYAQNNKFNIDKFFLVNIKRLCRCLNFERNEIVEAINNLIELEFIVCSKTAFKDTFLVHVNEDKIIDYKQQLEEENLFHSWDWGLVNCQNPKDEVTSFHKSTIDLMRFINNNFKYPNRIPTILYAVCDSYFYCFKNERPLPIDDVCVQKKILECLYSRDFKPINLATLVRDICNESEGNSYV